MYHIKYYDTDNSIVKGKICFLSLKIWHLNSINSKTKYNWIVPILIKILRTENALYPVYILVIIIRRDNNKQPKWSDLVFALKKLKAVR